MGDSGLVPETCQIACGQTSAIASGFQHCQFTVQPREETSPVEETAFDGISAIRKSLANQGISNRTQEIILDSWRSGTKKQYEVYLRKWNLFASIGGVDPVQPPVSKVLYFLTELYDCGLRYSGNCKVCPVNNYYPIERNHDNWFTTFDSKVYYNSFRDKTSFP